MTRFWAVAVWACVALDAAAEVPSFHKDISPILQRHCGGCHQAGGIAPMAFRDYATARPWAKAIRDAVKRKKMPPWFRESGTLEFSNDPSLSAEETTAIAAWADGGAPEGEVPSVIPSKPSQGKLSGDLVIEVARGFTVRPDATVPYQYVVLSAGQTADRWVQEVEIRPGAPEVVHHVVAYVREPNDVWLRDAPRGVPHVPAVRDRVTKSDILAVYTPGSRRLRFPDGMAKKLPAGAEIVLQFHYTSGRVLVEDRTRIALTFAKEAPLKRILTLQMGKDRLEIPPYERDHRVSVSGTLPNDALLLSLMPHMHLRGSAFEFEIVGERGRVEPLLRVKPFDFHWQLTYWLKSPRPLPKGTRLRWTGHFDNSANNLRNPNPAMTVGWGEQSWEEMMIGFFDVAVDPALDKAAFFIR